MRSATRILTRSFIAFILYLPLMKYIAFFICSFFVQNALSQTQYGRTTGPLPYLEYGLGDDRLGGAKMTYLDTAILLKVVDSTTDDYKVQLSQHHTAYVPKYNLKRDTFTKATGTYLSSSWRVWGDDKFDYVTIGLTEKLPYRSQQWINPSKLTVDIFGASSNTNWITQLQTVKAIKNVWYEQAEDDVLRVHIELAEQQHWGYLIYYKGNSLTVRIKRQPSLKLKNLLIAVDAGHGGTNTGASGMNSKALEKDLTLKMAKELQKYLRKKGAKVYMTREEDIDLSMIDRTLALRKTDPDLLISLHLNSSSNKAVHGTSTYYRYIGYRPLTQAVLHRMLQFELNDFGNIGAFNFALSGPTEYPNCLVEVAFLSNEEDEKKILSAQFQKDVAKKIARGIKDWLKNL